MMITSAQAARSAALRTESGSRMRTHLTVRKRAGTHSGRPGLCSRLVCGPYGAAILGLLVTSALAADIDGTWKWSFTGRDNTPRETTAKFKMEGDKLTGCRPTDVPRIGL